MIYKFVMYITFFLVIIVSVSRDNKKIVVVVVVVVANNVIKSTYEILQAEYCNADRTT